MTRIFSDGAEFGDLLFFDANGGAAASTGQKRTGSYSYLYSNNTIYSIKNIPSLSEFYGRFAFYIPTMDGSAYPIYRWYNDTTQLGDIRIDGTSMLVKAAVNNSVVATGTHPFVLAGWNLIEVHVFIDDSGIIDMKLNGVLDIDYSGDTKPSSASTIDRIRFYGGNWNYYYDDLALNDTSGSVDNSWCGNGRIEFLPANGEGDVLEWVPSSGSTHYTMVDDIPSNSDTDYVYASGSSIGVRDMYNVSDFTSTGKIIKRVWAEMRAKDNDATSGSIKLGFKTGGNVYLSSACRVLSSNYTKIVGDDALINPSDSADWEDTDLDNIQFVIENG